MKKKNPDNRPVRISVEEYLLLVAKKDQQEIKRQQQGNETQANPHTSGRGDVEMAEASGKVLPAKNRGGGDQLDLHQSQPKRARLANRLQPSLEQQAPAPQLNESRSVEEERAYIKTLSRHQRKVYKQLSNNERESLLQLLAGVSQQTRAQQGNLDGIQGEQQGVMGQLDKNQQRLQNNSQQKRLVQLDMERAVQDQDVTDQQRQDLLEKLHQVSCVQRLFLQ